MAVESKPPGESRTDNSARIAPETVTREFSLRAIILGALLGVIFGASSLYLVLKVGLTVSASIPVAVISLTLFRLWAKAGGRDATILENNIVQTAGSAGESIAFGLGVTMPAILILGFDLEIGRVMLVGLLGSLLGILMMMIPLRRALIVAQHGQLKYPEGTACAQVLKAGAALPSAGEPPGIRASTIFSGFGIGLAYKTLMSAFRLWKDIPEKVFGPPLKGGLISIEITPELLGVGSDLLTPSHGFRKPWKIPDTTREEWPLQINDLHLVIAQSGVRNGFTHFPRGQEVWGYSRKPLRGKEALAAARQS
jgi:uncharacterized oligopeptide transporter (OPT) family protein